MSDVHEAMKQVPATMWRTRMMLRARHLPNNGTNHHVEWLCEIGSS